MKMSLTVRVTLAVAAVSFLITLLAGLSAQIRWLSLLQRTAVSVVFFSFVGYLSCKWLEVCLRAMAPAPSKPHKGASVDVKSQPPQENLESFDPFTVEHFEKIERK